MLNLGARLIPAAGGLADSSRVGSGEDVRGILVVELWNIGDIVLTLPFLAQLRRIFPHARVTLLARPLAREVLQGTGLVDEFIATDLGWTAKTAKGNPLAVHWNALFRVWRELRRRRFDLAFQARAHVREHLVLAMSGARRRIGPALGAGNGALTDPIRRESSDRHKVNDWLALLQPFAVIADVPAPRLVISESERKWADEFLDMHGLLRSEELVGVHPGASVAEKRWPLDRFAELARVLSSKSGVSVLWFVDETGYGSSVAEQPEVTKVAVGLREMMALISRCVVLVSNDSGPMHIAGALGVPTVAIFGSGIAKWFGPLGSGHEMVAAPENASEAHRESQRGGGILFVTTAMVFDAVERVRARTQSTTIFAPR